MKSKRALRILTLCLVLIMAVACEYKDYPDPIWNPDETGGTTPVITAVDPADVVYDGITVVTITGTHFSEVAAQNQVTFNGQVATIDAAQSSTEQLVVTTPIVITDAALNAVDDVQLLVSVQAAFAGAIYDHPFRVERAVIEWGGFIGEEPAKNPNNVCVDANENVYVTCVDKNIYKIDPSGERTLFGGGLAVSTSDLKAGPGGSVYYTRNLGFIYNYPPEGGTPIRSFRIASKINCFDFTQDQKVYCGGKNDSLYYVDLTAQTTLGVTDAVDYDYLTLKVFDGYVYVGGSYVGTDAGVTVTEGIWRYEILTNHMLGTRELVYDWASYAHSAEQRLLSFIVDAQGMIYIGVSEGTGPAIIILDPTAQTVEGFYPAVLKAPSTKLVWGPGNYIYCARYSDSPSDEVPNGIFRISQSMTGAPYYGRD